MSTPRILGTSGQPSTRSHPPASALRVLCAAEQPLTQASSFFRHLGTVNKARAAGKGEESGRGGLGAWSGTRVEGRGCHPPAAAQTQDCSRRKELGRKWRRARAPGPAAPTPGRPTRTLEPGTRSLTRSALGASPVRTQARPGRKRQAPVTPETPETDLGAAGRRGEAGGLGKDQRALLPRALRSHSPGHGC